MHGGVKLLEQALDWHRSGQHAQICSVYQALLEHAMQEPKDAEMSLQIIFIALVRSGTADLAVSFSQWLIGQAQYVLAEQCMTHFLGQNPDNAMLWVAFSNLFVAQGNRVAAAEAMAHAVDRESKSAFRMQYAHLLGEIGDCNGALSQLAEVPMSERDLRWLWLHASLSPVVFQNNAAQDVVWHRCERGLVALQAAIEKASPQDCLAVLPFMTSLFSLQYLCHPQEVDLQKKYANVLETLMFRCYPEWRKDRPNQAKGGGLRIGIVSAFFRKHTVTRLYLPLFRHLSQGEHTVIGWSLGFEDDWTPNLGQLFSQFHRLPNKSFAEQAAHVATANLDLIIYPELGMNANTLKLAALRLAPHQAVGWGHPVTTGLSTIDYFLSSEMMEPENGQQWYTEKLVKLSGLGLSLAPPIRAKQLKKINAYPLPPASVRFLVSQSIFKVLPDHDRWFALLMKRVPDAQLVFLAGEGVNAGEHFQTRILQAFEREGTSTNCLIFVPRLSHDEFLSLNLACDIFIDGIAWSGGMTTLEALQCGLIPFTIAGSQMRTRHTHAIVRSLGLPELSVSNEEEWLALGTRLGTDIAFREHMVQQSQNALSNIWRIQKPLVDFDGWIEQL